MSYGITVADALTNIRTELQDNGASPRWSDALLLNYVNKGLRDLGQARCFECMEVLVGAQGQGSYTLGKEPVKVQGCWYDGRRVAAGDLWTFERDYGYGWSTVVAIPRAYTLAGPNLRLEPIPGTGGTTLATTGSPAITEAVGKGPGGDGYWFWNNAGTLEHFVPGDGYVTNNPQTGNVWVLYSYAPAAVTTSDYLANRIVDALEFYAAGRCLAFSDDKQEQRISENYLAAYGTAKDRLSSEIASRSSEYLPSFHADLIGWEYPRMRGSTRNVMAG